MGGRITHRAAKPPTHNRRNLRNLKRKKPIAHIRNDYTAKFGIPRQSGLVEEVISAIVFEPEYRNADAFRGLEGWSHLWLIWIFSEAVRDTWSPTVLPPRLPLPTQSHRTELCEAGGL